MTNRVSLKRRLANMVRRIPFVMEIATRVYRLLQGKASIGVVGVIIDDKYRVLLVEHVYHARYPWGLPGGWLDRGESPLTGLKRECIEEIGLQIEVIKPILVEKVTRFAHIDIIYYCKPRGEMNTLSGELLKARWVEACDLPPLAPLHLRAVHHALREHRLLEKP